MDSPTPPAGHSQSPIPIDDAESAELPGLELRYQPVDIMLTHTGYVVQANCAPGCSLIWEGRELHLQQFHFHCPAEHTLRGVRSPLEAHFVHADENGALTVVGTFFQPGVSHARLEALEAHIPAEYGAFSSTHRFDPSDLLPAKRSYLLYDGSLTMPPYTEGVRWILLPAVQQATSAQIDGIDDAMPYNARELQPRRGRRIRHIT